MMGQASAGNDSPAAIVGADPALRAVLARAARVAPTRIPVLVHGESGTGKELLARFIHDRGARPNGPFVAVNCGTLPRELADSELFGHERGAFTGAGARKVGWFEEAHGGTLVLDEVGELAFDLQSKLLRVLETGRLRRVGGTGEVAVNVRIVALTLRDLRNEVVRGGAFRGDLYHRLAGFELELPPLRDRRADIPLLIDKLLVDLAPEVGKCTVDAQAMSVLMEHDWPGNVRELRNVLRRALVLGGPQVGVAALDLPGGGGTVATPSGRHTFNAECLPRLADAETGSTLAATGFTLPPTRFAVTDKGGTLQLAGQTFGQIERAVLRWALEKSDGNHRRAARNLGVPRSTFCDKIKRYGLK